MRTRAEVFNAATRACEIARLLVYVGNAYGSPALVSDVMEWFDTMQNDKRAKDTTAFETGLVRLERDTDDMTFYTIYVNVGPSMDKREDL